MQRLGGAYLLKLATVLVGIVAGAVVDQATSGGWPLWLTVMIVVVVVAAWALWEWWQDRPRRDETTRPPPAPVTPDWVVDRPGELDDVVAKVLAHGVGPVGITTALRGAGGFGKTTLATMACADERVRRHFGGHVYQITVGRDVQAPTAIAGKVNEAVELITGSRPGLTDPTAAGQRLGQALDARPALLLVLDDVWEAEQLAPFLIGGRQCVRLVTTRVRQALPDDAQIVVVDRMSPEQAHTLLTWQLPSLPASTIWHLMDLTGRWPLLLRLINRILHDANRLGQNVNARARDLIDRLRESGSTAADALVPGSKPLDVNVPAERARAARVTIEASTSRLTEDGDRARLLELGIFAEDEPVPVAQLQWLWAATAGLDAAAAARLCHDLDRLSLVTISQTGDGPVVVTLHDVIRSYLRAELGESGIRTVNRALVDTVAATLPTAAPLVDKATPSPAWWALPVDDQYLWTNLAYHVAQADRPGQFDTAITDLRWVAARLLRSGPVAPIADLAHATTTRAASLERLLIRASHLLTPTDPASAVVHVLLCRLRDHPSWHDETSRLQAGLVEPHLVSRWPLPDPPDSALRRTFAGHTSTQKGYHVTAVAISPDGTWLASASDDKTVLLWDAATGRVRVTLTGHTHSVTAMAIARDGTWLATASHDRTVRLWDAATGRVRATLTGYTNNVYAKAIFDGIWLASASGDATVRVWDAATGAVRATLSGHNQAETAVAIAPDGTWLATTSSLERTVRLWDAATGMVRATISCAHCAVEIAPDGTWLATANNMEGKVQLWDAATGAERATLTGNTDAVCRVAISPDGTWLATASERDRAVRLRDAATGAERATLTGHTDQVNAIAISPDGTWLATASNDQTVRLWDATGTARASRKSHAAPMHTVAIAPDDTWLASTSKDWKVWLWDAATGIPRAILAGQWLTAISPDGTWLATASSEGTMRVWDAATGAERAAFTGHNDRVHAVAISPDGTWLATAGGDATVRLWDTATGVLRTTLTGHTDRVHAVVISPDGTWLATAGGDATVRLWEAATGAERATLTGHSDDVHAVVISPDGTWLATASGYAPRGSDTPIDSTVRLWDAATGAERATLTGHNDDVHAVVISPDGTWLATASNSAFDLTARLWDAATGAERASLTGHTGRLTKIVISPDGTWLATASSVDGTVRLWDATSGAERAIFADPPLTESAVAIAPDSARMAIGSHDGSLRIVDVASGRCAAFMRVELALHSCAWTTDSRMIAVAGDSGLYLFELCHRTDPSH